MGREADMVSNVLRNVKLLCVLSAASFTFVVRSMAVAVVKGQ